MKRTQVLYCRNLNQGKHKQLEQQANLLGKVRSKVWCEYGMLAGLGKSDRKIRDAWMKQCVDFGVFANAWKETLRDCIADIKAYREAAKVKVKRAIRERTECDEERKRLYTLLKFDKWTEDNFLHRQMRKHFKHGKNHTFNQIIIRSDMCKTFEINGQCWLKVPSLIKGKPIHLPLNTTMEFAPTGTLRLILKDGSIEVHSSYDSECLNDCGSAQVGIDKGFTEAFVDSNGDTFGDGLGKLISDESDYLNIKYQRRNKLRAIAEKKSHKANNIYKNSLGRKKLKRRQDKQKAKLKTLIYTAAHKLADKAGLIVCEDLSSPIQSKRNYGKNTNRRLNTWTKGYLADALESISQSRGSTLRLVNAAYTSQMDSQTGLLLGKRVGDKFYRINGEVIASDYNAAVNILSRLTDFEISLHTPYKKVKCILQERTNRYKLELTNLGSSCTVRYQQNAN